MVLMALVATPAVASTRVRLAIDVNGRACTIFVASDGVSPGIFAISDSVAVFTLSTGITGDDAGLIVDGVTGTLVVVTAPAAGFTVV